MTVLGIGALTLLFAWLFGGFVLRLGGLLLVFAGVIGLAVAANGNGIPVAAIGAFVWLLGQGHYALRHRNAAKSPLAQLLFEAVASAWRRFCQGLQGAPPPEEPEPDGAVARHRGAERRIG